MPLILEKITTPAEAPRVSRRRLLEELSESLACCNSTVLAGRAGTGKTLLAADFAARCGRRVAWYKVDAPETDLRMFLQYLVAAVRRQRPGFGGKTLALLALSDAPEEATLMAESLVYELTALEGAEPLLVVIDDLHLVYDADWVVPFFGRLLPLLPAEVHLMLLSRTLPPAPLWRMRSKQTLRVLDEQALGFTLAEAAELFASYGLTAKQAAQALSEAWGRPASLDAAARELRETQPAGSLVEAAVGKLKSAGTPLRLVKGHTAEPPLGAS